MKHLCLFLIVEIVIIVGEEPAEQCHYEPNTRKYFCKDIESVFPKIFYGNYHLECINCNIPTFTNATFPFANSLLSFNATSSRIRFIGQGAFSTLSNVQYIFLQNNYINDIAPGSFSGLRQVYELHLENNHLAHVSPGFLADMEANTVNLYDNKVQTLPDGAFEGSLGIMILDFSANAIKTIQEHAFVSLENLEVLNLEKNNLCYLPLGLFRYLANLRQLNLADNRLSKFSVGTFSGLKSLYTLNLANNSLAGFNGNVVIPLAHLSKLDISGNGIYYFDANSVFVSAPTLRTLRIDDNLLSCGHLINIVQYFRSKNVDVANAVARYNVQNVIGIACTEMIISSTVDFEQFLKVVEEDTKKYSLAC